MTKLLIVESPTKAKTIRPMLGPEWDVRASVGHIRDLPKNGMNVERSGAYAMTYEVIAGKTSIINGLRSAARAAGREVYLATDPDREGESIAWHLEVLLRLSNPYRVTFHELTAAAIKDAIAHPKRIDRDLVAAQETRRALDRLYGYDVSSALSRRLGAKRSAGRVQTIGLQLIVDREREITAFVPRAHHTVTLTLRGAQPWTAEWKFAPLLARHETLWTDTAFANRVAAIRAVRVAAYEESISRSAPPPPFTSSTLTQSASNRLKFGAKKTMRTAQALFDDGHITYHRTDSLNLASTAIAGIRAWATAHGLPLPPFPRTWKAKALAQGAHEAIRPTRIADDTPKGLSGDALALYGLIRLRAIASQLADATFDVRDVTLDGGLLDKKPIIFVGRSSTTKTSGWKALYPTAPVAPSSLNPVPVLKVGDRPVVEDGKRVDRMTEPPLRFTEATLIKTLEDRGIGRPSTYASIVETIQDRGYVEIGKDRFFRPLPDGVEAIDTLKGAFAFVNVDYTKQMEDRLDDIAHGKATYVQVVSEADRALVSDLARFAATAPKRPTQPFRQARQAHARTRPPAARSRAGSYRCPTCRTADLRLRRGPTGEFWGCAGYPVCRATFPDVGGKPKMATMTQRKRRRMPRR